MLKFAAEIEKDPPADADETQAAGKVYRAIAWTAEPTRDGQAIDPSLIDVSGVPLPLLREHDRTQIVGTVQSAALVNGAIEIAFTLLDSADSAREAIAALALNHVSVALLPVDDGRFELVEVSLVAVPAHPDAEIIQRSAAQAPTADAQANGAPQSKENIMQQGPTLGKAPAVITSDKIRQFSLAKLIRAALDPAHQAQAGFELEMSAEAARIGGKPAGSLVIPWGAFGLRTFAQDAVTPPSGTPPTDVGISLAQPANHADLFTITSDASFKQSAAGQLGVPVYQAPLGGFGVPRMVEPLVPQWVARDSAVPDTTGRFDLLSATPHTLGGVCEIKRSALIDCAPPMQTVISDALWAAVMSALDQALLGTLPADADAPAGLYQLLTGTAQDFGECTPSELLYALAAVADVNTDPLAFIAGNSWGAYASITAINASLNQRSLRDSMPAAFPISLNGRMNAFDGGGAVPQLHSMFGPWSTYAMTVLFGGGVQLLVNPFASGVYEKGAILVRVMVDADILIRDASRFGMAYNTDTP